MHPTRRFLLTASTAVAATAVLGTIGAGMVYRNWWDQPADVAMGVLSTDELAFLDAFADAIFPPDTGLPLRGREAQVGRTVDAVLVGMHPNQSKLVRLSLHALDQYSLPTHGTAFRNLPIDAAREVLHSLVSTEITEVRGLVASIYIFVALGWSIHPTVAPTLAVQFKCGYGA